MTDKFVAITGCGLWGRNLVRNFYNLGALHTVCDLDFENLKVVKDSYSSVVNVKSSYEMERIELYNTFGQVVYTNDVNANNVTVSTANLEKGTYFVKAYANGMTATKKVVVE